MVVSALVLRTGLPFLRAAVFLRTRLRRTGFALLLGLRRPFIPVHLPLIPLLRRRLPLHPLIGLGLLWSRTFHLPIGLLWLPLHSLIRRSRPFHPLVGLRLPFHSLVGPFLPRSIILRTPLNRGG